MVTKLQRDRGLAPSLHAEFHTVSLLLGSRTCGEQIGPLKDPSWRQGSHPAAGTSEVKGKSLPPSGGTDLSKTYIDFTYC